MEQPPHHHPKNKSMMIIGAVAVISIVIIAGWLLMKKDNPKVTEKSPTVIKNEAAIPTVDASVQVDLAYTEPRKKVRITVNSIPAKTDMIEYAVTYDLSNGGLQGFQGEIKPAGKAEAVTDGKNLGTCSSGVCRYDDITGHMKIDMKFTGDYGERLFEKEFQL